MFMHWNLSPIALRLKKMCNKAVKTYHSKTQIVPDSYKT